MTSCDVWNFILPLRIKQWRRFILTTQSSCSWTDNAVYQTKKTRSPAEVTGPRHPEAARCSGISFRERKVFQMGHYSVFFVSPPLISPQLVFLSFLCLPLSPVQNQQSAFLPGVALSLRLLIDQFLVIVWQALLWGSPRVLLRVIFCYFLIPRQHFVMFNKNFSFLFILCPDLGSPLCHHLKTTSSRW